MSRIKEKFDQLRRQQKKALIPFITAGFPNLTVTKKLIFSLERAGADLIELGIPFSDPMADGPVIQHASEVAVRKGVTLKKILSLVRGVRKNSAIPMVLMGYYNPIFAFGLKKFAREAATAGVDGLLVVDLPPEESAPLDRELHRQGIDRICLLTPTSNPERIRQGIKRASGYLYFVSMTGVTGASLQSGSDIQNKIAKIRHSTSLPIVVGFGIKKKSQVTEINRYSDGVVVGSALVQRLKEAGSIQPALAFFRSLVIK